MVGAEVQATRDEVLLDPDRRRHGSWNQWSGDRADQVSSTRQEVAEGAPVMDVIVDIDGTLAEISHRRHYVASKPKNWKAFNASMHLDEPNTPVIEVVRALWTLPLVDEYGPETRILLASGRGEEFRGVTEDWLLKNR